MPPKAKIVNKIIAQFKDRSILSMIGSSNPIIKARILADVNRLARTSNIPNKLIPAIKSNEGYDEVKERLSAKSKIRDSNIK